MWPFPKATNETAHQKKVRKLLAKIHMTQVELANELTAANARLAAANTNLANANNQLLKVNGEIDALKQLVTDGATSAEVIAALEALKVTTGNVETTVQETQNQAQTADDKNPDAPTPA